MEWKVGDVKITKVVEHELPIPLNGLLKEPPADAAEKYPWLTPDFLDAEGNAVLSIHGLVIDTGERRILVDTCVGENREDLPLPPPGVNFIAALAAAGYEIDDIDTILCTHLHFDHVGWNTHLVDGSWVPTFPNSRYLFARIEWDHWQVTEGSYINVNDTVRPVVEAGLADLVETNHVVCDQVRLVPTPGHTPGHVSVVIESGSERAVITGDMAHHPIQFAEPDLGMDADSDGQRAAATRRTFAGERAHDHALVIGTHFGGRTAGHLVADGETWRFDP